jgi:hypothetical protein
MEQIKENTRSYNIVDPLIEPYYIEKDTYNFTVVEKGVSTRGFGGKEASGKETLKTIGFYSTLGAALLSISKLKSHSSIQKSEIVSIKEYIDEYKKIETQINNLINTIQI